MDIEDKYNNELHLDLQKIIEQFVDFLIPELTPYQSSVYMILLRNSFPNRNLSVRIGKRSIALKMGLGVRGTANYNHISDTLDALVKNGCIKVGDTSRLGTLYTVVLPEDISILKHKFVATLKESIEDYFTDKDKRNKLFERDNWICHYCGDKVTSENATLDHIVPQCKGGAHNKDNLTTSCLVCNSIKSGKMLEEVALLLLTSIQERRTRLHQ